MEGTRRESANDVKKRDYLSFETLEQGERAGAAFVGGWKGEKAVEDDARAREDVGVSRGGEFVAPFGGDGGEVALWTRTRVSNVLVIDQGETGV